MKKTIINMEKEKTMDIFRPILSDSFPSGKRYTVFVAPLIPKRIAVKDEAKKKIFRGIDSE